MHFALAFVSSCVILSNIGPVSCASDERCEGFDVNPEVTFKDQIYLNLDLSENALSSFKIVFKGDTITGQGFCFNWNERRREYAVTTPSGATTIRLGNAGKKNLQIVVDSNEEIQIKDNTNKKTIAFVFNDAQPGVCYGIQFLSEEKIHQFHIKDDSLRCNQSVSETTTRIMTTASTTTTESVAETTTKMSTSTTTTSEITYAPLVTTPKYSQLNVTSKSTSSKPTDMFPITSFPTTEQFSTSQKLSTGGLGMAIVDDDLNAVKAQRNHACTHGANYGAWFGFFFLIWMQAY